MGAALRMAASRRGAGWLLLASWLLVFAASALGDLDNPGHAAGPRVFAAVLLWLVWRGGTWSRGLLLVLSTIAAGFTLGLVFSIALGASGINTTALAMLAIYAASGALLLTPPVRDLSRAVPRNPSAKRYVRSPAS